MARSRMTFLDEKEMDLIHTQSITLLNEMGVLVHSKSVLQLLEEKGAHVDYEKMTATFSEKMINSALGTAPKEITLFGRDPKHDLHLPAKDVPYSVTNGLAVFVMDKDTGQYRDCDSKDLADFMKLADALNGIDYVWPSLAAKDKPPQTQTLYELWITMQNTSKHIQGDAIHGAHNAKAQIEMASLVVGGKEKLKERPIFSVISCPIAPLSFEKGSIEAQVELARAGIPIASMSMSLGGLSAPITVAGMITNANAENLAGLVITQAASPGAPHIYTSDSTPMDMATGNINYGAPELSLVSFGTAQMAERYNLPAFVSGFGLYNLDYEENEAFCKTVNTMLTAAAKTDIVGGLGGIDSANGVCFKQLLLDAYTWECCRDYLKPVEISERTIAIDAIRDVGHGGNFLIHKHTMENLRKSMILWNKERLSMISLGKNDFRVEAGKIVNRLLNEYQPLPIDENIIRQGYDIIKTYEKKYAE